MSRLCPTKFVGVLPRDVGIKLNWVTILNMSALYILLNSSGAIPKIIPEGVWFQISRQHDRE
ncbi:hypothetical protein HanRHA438_Chr01g0006051 [Helianthus annuus]|nr:hypothetical protein HanIR_Chr01g0006201 [Helianthus annuus]KAJ0946627.1 hypothetical protein HanRHA438_Chr01g0006051 [Helianthus annuus]